MEGISWRHKTRALVSTGTSPISRRSVSQALPTAVTAAAATELLSRVQASLTAGFSAGAVPWPAASAPVMSLPASTMGLLLAAPATAKPLAPALLVAHDLQAPQLAVAGAHQQTRYSASNIEAAALTAVPADTTGAQVGASAEPQQQ